MSDTVLEDFNGNAARNVQAAVMAAQELARLVAARIEKGLTQEIRQQEQLKAMLDIALHHARSVVENLYNEKFYELASKADLYDAYVTAHSFAQDPYCAEGVRKANARLGLTYAPGQFTNDDALELQRRMGLRNDEVVARYNQVPTWKQVEAGKQVKKTGVQRSFVERLKAASSAERAVMIYQGAHPRKLADLLNKAKPGKKFTPAPQPVVNQVATQKM